MSRLIFGQAVMCRRCKGSGQETPKTVCPKCKGSGIGEVEPVNAPPPQPSVRPTPVPEPTGFARGMADSQLSADAHWTALDRLALVRAIENLAALGEDFTTDDVWAAMPPDFPVSKGIGAVINSQVRRGILRNTGRTRLSTREGEHGKGQRLTIWRGVD